MLTYNHSYDGGTFEESTWPSYYPEYNSPLGWEIEKLDAQIQVCKKMLHVVKSATNMANIAIVRAKAELLRHDILGRVIFGKHD